MPQKPVATPANGTRPSASSGINRAGIPIAAPGPTSHPLVFGSWSPEDLDALASTCEALTMESVAMSADSFYPNQQLQLLPQQQQQQQQSLHQHQQQFQQHEMHQAGQPVPPATVHAVCLQHRAAAPSCLHYSDTDMGDDEEGDDMDPVSSSFPSASSPQRPTPGSCAGGGTVSYGLSSAAHDSGSGGGECQYASAPDMCDGDGGVPASATVHSYFTCNLTTDAFEDADADADISRAAAGGDGGIAAGWGGSDACGAAGSAGADDGTAAAPPPYAAATLAFNPNTGFLFNGMYFMNYAHLMAYRRSAIAYNFHYFGIRPEFHPPSNLPRPPPTPVGANTHTTTFATATPAAAAAPTAAAASSNVTGPTSPAAPTTAVATVVTAAAHKDAMQLTPSEPAATWLTEACQVCLAAGSGSAGLASGGGAADDGCSSCCGSPGSSSTCSSGAEESDDGGSDGGPSGAVEEAAAELEALPESQRAAAALLRAADASVAASKAAAAAAYATAASGAQEGSSGVTWDQLHAPAAAVSPLPLSSLRCRGFGGGPAGAAAGGGRIEFIPGEALSPSRTAAGVLSGMLTPPLLGTMPPQGGGSPTAGGGACPTWLEPQLGAMLGLVVDEALWGAEEAP